MKTFQIISTFVLTLFFAATGLNAQWTTNAGTTSTMNNVGIGTTNTNYNLHISGKDMLLNNQTDNKGLHFRVDGTSAWISNRNNFVGNGTVEQGNLALSTGKDLRFQTGNNNSGNVGYDRLVIKENGNIGIATGSPKYNMHINGADMILHNQGSNKGIHFRVDGSSSWISNRNNFMGNGTLGQGNLTLSSGKDLRFQTGSGNGNVGYNHLVIKESGLIQIGTNQTPNGYKLAVGGKIIAEELVIKLSQNWADYVFLPSYKRLSLEEVKEHIEAKGYLHNTPSATEIESDGLSVGEITINQQEKIEELYLHMIEINETVKALKAENEELKEELAALKTSQK